ncbi:MAG TPA: hydrogenase maturation nickel metallochaperone HypA [Polyangiaceae bacterium]
MHELAISESLIAMIEENAVARGFRRVRKVRVEIGRLSSVHAPSMRMCFAVVSRGTMAEHAELDVIDVPGRGSCASCGRQFEIARHAARCPHCMGAHVAVVEGTGMRLKELVVE